MVKVDIFLSILRLGYLKNYSKKRIQVDFVSFGTLDDTDRRNDQVGTRTSFIDTLINENEEYQQTERDVQLDDCHIEVRITDQNSADEIIGNGLLNLKRNVERIEVEGAGQEDGSVLYKSIVWRISCIGIEEPIFLKLTLCDSKENWGFRKYLEHVIQYFSKKSIESMPASVGKIERFEDIPEELKEAERDHQSFVLKTPSLNREMNDDSIAPRRKPSVETIETMRRRSVQREWDMLQSFVGESESLVVWKASNKPKISGNKRLGKIKLFGKDAEYEGSAKLIHSSREKVTYGKFWIPSGAGIVTYPNMKLEVSFVDGVCHGMGRASTASKTFHLYFNRGKLYDQLCCIEDHEKSEMFIGEMSVGGMEKKLKEDNLSKFNVGKDIKNVFKFFSVSVDPKLKTNPKRLFCESELFVPDAKKDGTMVTITVRPRRRSDPEVLAEVENGWMKAHKLIWNQFVKIGLGTLNKALEGDEYKRITPKSYSRKVTRDPDVRNVCRMFSLYFKFCFGENSSLETPSFGNIRMIFESAVDVIAEGVKKKSWEAKSTIFNQENCLSYVKYYVRDVIHQEGGYDLLMKYYKDDSFEQEIEFRSKLKPILLSLYETGDNILFSFFKNGIDQVVSSRKSVERGGLRRSSLSVPQLDEELLDIITLLVEFLKKCGNRGIFTHKTAGGDLDVLIVKCVDFVKNKVESLPKRERRTSKEESCFGNIGSKSISMDGTSLGLLEDDISTLIQSIKIARMKKYLENLIICLDSFHKENEFHRERWEGFVLFLQEQCVALEEKNRWTHYFDEESASKILKNMPSHQVVEMMKVRKLCITLCIECVVESTKESISWVIRPCKEKLFLISRVLLQYFNEFYVQEPEKKKMLTSLCSLLLKKADTVLKSSRDCLMLLKKLKLEELCDENKMDAMSKSLWVLLQNVIERLGIIGKRNMADYRNMEKKGETSLKDHVDFFEAINLLLKQSTSGIRILVEFNKEVNSLISRMRLDTDSEIETPENLAILFDDIRVLMGDYVEMVDILFRGDEEESMCNKDLAALKVILGQNRRINEHLRRFGVYDYLSGKKKIHDDVDETIITKDDLSKLREESSFVPVRQFISRRGDPVLDSGILIFLCAFRCLISVCKTRVGIIQATEAMKKSGCICDDVLSSLMKTADRKVDICVHRVLKLVLKPMGMCFSPPSKTATSGLHDIFYCEDKLFFDPQVFDDNIKKRVVPPESEMFAPGPYIPYEHLVGIIKKIASERSVEGKMKVLERFFRELDSELNRINEKHHSEKYYNHRKEEEEEEDEGEEPEEVPIMKAHRPEENKNVARLVFTLACGVEETDYVMGDGMSRSELLNILAETRFIDDCGLPFFGDQQYIFKIDFCGYPDTVMEYHPQGKLSRSLIDVSIPCGALENRLKELRKKDPTRVSIQWLLGLLEFVRLRVGLLVGSRKNCMHVQLEEVRRKFRRSRRSEEDKEEVKEEEEEEEEEDCSSPRELQVESPSREKKKIESPEESLPPILMWEEKKTEEDGDADYLEKRLEFLDWKNYILSNLRDVNEIIGHLKMKASYDPQFDELIFDFEEVWSAETYRKIQVKLENERIFV